jgi:hypothetical protein
MKKHIKDWDIGFVFTEFTYDLKDNVLTIRMQYRF